MKELVQRYEEAGAFANHGAAHSLKVHLITVSRFEEKGAAEKVVKHMKGFKLLLDHQKKEELISYNVLKAPTDDLIEKWQWNLKYFKPLWQGDDLAQGEF